MPITTIDRSTANKRRRLSAPARKLTPVRKARRKDHGTIQTYVFCEDCACKWHRLGENIWPRGQCCGFKTYDYWMNGQFFRKIQVDIDAQDLFCVAVGTGKSERHYLLEKRRLSALSPYFSALLSFPGLEKEARLVHLTTDVDIPEAFERCVEYLATKQPYEAPTLDSRKPPGYREIDLQTITAAVRLHAQVYLLAHRLLAPEVMEHAMGETRRILALATRKGSFAARHCVSEGGDRRLEGVLETAELVYGNTAEGDSKDGLRAVLAGFLSYQMLKPSARGDGTLGGLREVAVRLPDCAVDMVRHLQGFDPYERC